MAKCVKVNTRTVNFNGLKFYSQQLGGIVQFV